MQKVMMMLLAVFMLLRVADEGAMGDIWFMGGALAVFFFLTGVKRGEQGAGEAEGVRWSCAELGSELGKCWGSGFALRCSLCFLFRDFHRAVLALSSRTHPKRPPF